MAFVLDKEKELTFLKLNKNKIKIVTLPCYSGRLVRFQRWGSRLMEVRDRQLFVELHGLGASIFRSNLVRLSVDQWQWWREVERDREWFDLWLWQTIDDTFLYLKIVPANPRSRFTHGSWRQHDYWLCDEI